MITRSVKNVRINIPSGKRDECHKVRLLMDKSIGAKTSREKVN